MIMDKLVSERAEGTQGQGMVTVKSYYTIQADDVGRSLIQAFGRTWCISGFIGRVLPGDVGKRVYLSEDVLQVESDEQRDRRLACLSKRLAMPASRPNRDIVTTRVITGNNYTETCTDSELTTPLRNCLERIALGKQAQLGPGAGGLSFVVLAGMLEERGLARTVRHRDGTRTYTLTGEGRRCLARMRVPKKKTSGVPGYSNFGGGGPFAPMGSPASKGQR
jgi:hypothetical protein